MGSSKLGGGGNWIFQFCYSSQFQLVLLLRRCFYHFLSEQYLLVEPLSTTSNEELFLKNLNLSTIDHNKLRINFGSLTQFNFLLWNRCTLIPKTQCCSWKTDDSISQNCKNKKFWMVVNHCGRMLGRLQLINYNFCRLRRPRSQETKKSELLILG